ncbi:KAP family P-loop NTPase fold protein [Pontixanthobacter gangjinensis]|uniref:KAP NTPase domain-containing protein n=1 Tax=Pontixanthobacter gangjinensis TaxID=1028742 RepID=A0A6I4SJD7_9SPHN|nr:P-loop NTPase fold protein [Pontixanthobacter gangjinensis]MXO55783.1 hypothetical protein [Pontixanthobacter gangjinensis]
MSGAAISGDRPLEAGGNDRLGFADVAARLATSLVDHASDKGLVVGVDGKWGSGKSSLLHLIEMELKELPAERKPSIINFRPWVIGNRDTLLASLFAALSDEMNRVELAAGDATGVSKQKAKTAAEALRKFVSGLGRTGAAIELVGDATAFTPIKWFGKGVTAIGNAVSAKPPEPPLSELKGKLVKALEELNHRFIVTIDDVDRLEPAEAIEVLRLARSVADFPNVTYLLCFDGEVLAKSIQHAAGVEDGRGFLEKIIQLTVMVPMPEAFRLRQWFSDELRRFAFTKNEDELSRLKGVIDFEGGRRLNTPRSVNRVLDSLRFFWPPIEAVGGDLADLVWLQLIRDGNPELYRWIEQYCATNAIMSLGTVRVDKVEKVAQHSALLATVPSGHFSDLTYRYYFSEPLPGADCDYNEEGGSFNLYQLVDEADRNAAIHARRLASPDHYRLYFALTGPKHALTQGDVDEFWEAAKVGASDIGKTLLRLHDVELHAGFGKADLLLERLKGADPERLTGEHCKPLLIAFSNYMDKAHEVRPMALDWVTTLWDRAEATTQVGIGRVDPADRNNTVKTMFEEGEAIGWLTSVMRRETFFHGRYGTRRKPESEWIFTAAELDLIFKAMLARFNAMSAEELLATSRPIDLLFAWRQAGDEDSPRALIEEYARTSEGLVEALEKMTSVRNSSDRGTRSVLTRQNVESFVNFDDARTRVKKLAASDDPLAPRAAKLSLAFDDNDSF